jgi:hypothetical protein
MEAGESGIALGMWLNAFEVLGLLGVFAEVSDPIADSVARAALARPVRKRKAAATLDF